MMHNFLGKGFEAEFLYTFIVVVLCFLVYYKTKEIYELTKHQGIKYFRSAFLFFGLAYLSRFLLHIVILMGISFSFIISRRVMFLPVFTVPVTYLSTMAIFFLIYSTIWKKIKYKYFIILSNIIAISISVIAFCSKSLILISALQLLLLLITVVISTKDHRKTKKKYTRTLYFLISVLWLINLFLLSPGRILLFGSKIFFQAFSIIVFVVVYLKVLKWVK
ncbi:MAG: hypothetical protein PHV16_04340 [Candidatus Nanoarchaeia archaeon]|nr:hypothetical protein [Candidatus Nanoarchaeia archaeon]